MVAPVAIGLVSLSLCNNGHILGGGWWICTLLSSLEPFSEVSWPEDYGHYWTSWNNSYETNRYTKCKDFCHLFVCCLIISWWFWREGKWIWTWYLQLRQYNPHGSSTTDGDRGFSNFPPSGSLDSLCAQDKTMHIILKASFWHLTRQMQPALTFTTAMWGEQF